MISKVLRGDYGLLKTFWLGLAINLVVRIVGTKIQDTLIYSQIQNGFILDLLTFSLIYVVFLLVWLVGVWKSGNRYVGLRLWVVLSRWVSVLIVLVYLGAAVLVVLTHFLKLPLSELLRFTN